MDSESAQEPLRSELVRHPVTGELFMIDRAARGELLALAGPLGRRLAWTGHGPRALISLAASVDWFVRPVDAQDAAARADDVIRAVLAWAERIAWQPVADYRRVDEFADPPPDEESEEDELRAGEPRFVRTLYLLESVTSTAVEAPRRPVAPPPAEPGTPLWAGPGPVNLG